MKRFFASSLLVVVVAATALIASACATTSYIGPDYVSSWNTGKPKAVEQRSLGREVDNVMSPTYDEEFIYDANGNLIKFRQTEYISTTNAEKKEFIVWETEYKVLGGKVVPAKISVNGVVFVELEYQLLSTKSTGRIKQPTSNRRFTQKASSYFSGSSYTSWFINLGSYPIPFNDDDQFVITVEDSDGDTYNILTLGYDNIALKSFTFSLEKRMEGLGKTNASYNSGLLRSFAANNSVSFVYDWQVVADRICQVKMVYSGQHNVYSGGYFRQMPVTFVAEMAYDPKGNCIKETWTHIGKKGDEEVSTVVFEQLLKY